MEVWCVVLIACIVSQARAGGDKLSECTSQSTVELSCPVSYVIRVLEKLVICCSQEEDCSAASSCVHRLPPSELCPSCNGRQLCNETVLVSQDAFCPEHLLPRYFQVNYTCVSITQTSNICGDDIETPALHYLGTPDFPGQVLPVSRPLCRCRVQGESIAVTAVQIDLPFDGSSLTLTDVNTSTPLWTSTHGQTASLYNTLLHSRQGLQTLDITFSPSLDRVQTAWIEIKAISPLEIGCGFRASFTTRLPPSTSSPSTMSPVLAARETSRTEHIFSSSSVSSARTIMTTIRNTAVSSSSSSDARFRPSDSTNTVEQSSSTLQTAPISGTSAPSAPSTLTFTSLLPPSPSTATNPAKHCGVIRNQCDRKRISPNDSDQGLYETFRMGIILGSGLIGSCMIVVAVIIYIVWKYRNRHLRRRMPPGSGGGGEWDFPSNRAAQHFNSYVDYVNHIRGAWERADDQQRSTPSSGGNPEADVPSNEDVRIFREPEPDYPRDAGVHITADSSVAYVNYPYSVGEITAQ